jgi:cell division protein FtsB
MQEGTLFSEKKEAADEPLPLRQRARGWIQEGWRPAGTVVAVALTLAFAWSVINGRHGLTFWYQQRTQDKELKREIQDLEQENTHLRSHIDRLKSDPGAIEHEAREKLHYAKPGEVIYTLPVEPKAQEQPAGSGK